jgi:hypothetical protein
MFGEKAALREEAYLQRQRTVEEAKRERLYSQRCPRPRGLSREINGTSAPDQGRAKALFFDVGRWIEHIQ